MIWYIIGIAAWAIGFVFYFQRQLIDNGCVHLLNPDENESGESGAKRLAIVFLILCILWPIGIAIDVIINLVRTIRLAIILVFSKKD